MIISKMAKPELWKQAEGFVGMCEHIARCAAICYNSEPKTGGAAVDFVRRLIKLGHGRALEFGTVRLPRFVESDLTGCKEMWTYIHIDEDGTAWTNLRAALRIIGSFDDIEAGGDLMTEGVGMSGRFTVHYPAIARSIADELRTHTMLSTLMRSTRFVSAGGCKGKKANVEFIAPYWYGRNEYRDMLFRAALEDAEDAYQRILACARCQQARDVLSLCVKTEMVQCGFRDAWENLVTVRSANNTHPDAKSMAQKVGRSVLSRKDLFVSL